MNEKQAFKKYTQMEAFIDSHFDEIRPEKNWFENLVSQMPGLSIALSWQDFPREEEKSTFFDKCMDDYFEDSYNCDDEVCTVVFEGVFTNVLIHSGVLAVGPCFGFTDDKGYFSLCRKNDKMAPGFYILKNTFIDDHLHEKLARLGISDDGERWVLKQNGSELRYRSLDDLRSENGLDYQFDLEGITTAELQKHRYDHIG